MSFIILIIISEFKRIKRILSSFFLNGSSGFQFVIIDSKIVLKMFG